jgi:hypothetical protein
MSPLQIIYLILFIFTIIATVKVIRDLISIDHKVKQILKIEKELKDNYHIMTSYQVQRSNEKKQNLEESITINN